MSNGEKEPLSFEIPKELPILPVRDIIIYPIMIAPLQVGREKSINLVDNALIGDKIIGLVAQKDSKIEDPNPDDLYNYGTAVQIMRKLKLPGNAIQIFVQGIVRIKIIEYTQRMPFLKAYVEKIPEKEEITTETKAIMQNVLTNFQKIVSLSPYLPNELGIIAMNIESPGRLADFVASNLNIKLEEREEILETLDGNQRLEKLFKLLNRELEILELGSKIQAEAQSELGKAQREYFLRQQLKAIQKELGEVDEKTAEINELKEKIKNANMPSDVEKEANRELDRLAVIPPQAAEYTVIRTYLDWLITLPWVVSTEDNLDINMASNILDEDHYNLEKVKERILEYLAVQKLKKDMKGPILCFLGPPGVGKTSLGKSIARALGRKFIRISIGGVRDEAEIRGHRRTYVGALPGRIIQSIRKVGTNNPLFMIDEVDKIGADFRGDPASALLEVLDPEQNNSFVDHYLDVPFDLSKVMFIATANIIDPVPPALKDRMEVIEIPGYIEEEKLIIARKYIIPRQLKEHGIEERHVDFTDGAVIRVIREYTREAGVRNLEREIAAICRKVAKEVASGKEEKVIVEDKDIPQYLGPLKFFSEIGGKEDEIGVATGLAWTSSGGEILFVEATKMKGKKGLILTGQLGDVMKESAQAALSYIRSRAKELNIREDFFEDYDIHIHVPAGAIPKDGPSAGITMTLALASIMTEKPVRHDIAMTGEITLRGRILPVGGIKEKVLAAKRAGISKVILPDRNRKDLDEIPKHIRDNMEFIFVKEMEEVLNIALK
jgi:ATP-dependent Lon protease